MDTRRKSNVKFRAKVNEALARHEGTINDVNSNFEHLNATLQAVLFELQSLQVSTPIRHQIAKVNPFHQDEPSSLGTDVNRSQLKLSFSKFVRDDLQWWIYKAEQYFLFQECSIGSAGSIIIISFGRIIPTMVSVVH